MNRLPAVLAIPAVLAMLTFPQAAISQEQCDLGALDIGSHDMTNSGCVSGLCLYGSGHVIGKNNYEYDLKNENSYLTFDNREIARGPARGTLSCRDIMSGKQ